MKLMKNTKSSIANIHNHVTIKKKKKDDKTLYF